MGFRCAMRLSAGMMRLAIAFGSSVCCICAHAERMDAVAAAIVQTELSSLLSDGNANPAPQSPLITSSALSFDLVNVDRRNRRLTLLVLKSSSSAPKVVALASRMVVQTTATYAWYPTSVDPCLAGEVDLVTLEHLFRLAMNDVVSDTFHFHTGGAGDGSSIAPLTHAGLLARIAEARECIASKLASTGAVAPKKWRVSVLEPAGPVQHKSIVSARLRLDGMPLANATVLFTRAPHMECSATTTSAGIATCDLEDTHGHEDHAEESDAPTFASFPGRLTPDTIFIPTTAVDRRGGAGQGSGPR